MSKSKVEQYLDANGKKRYRVKDVPIFAPVGTHKLTDGSEMLFDEAYVEKAAKRTRELESENEHRPMHVFHWDFNRMDGKPPDAECPNFGFLENTQLTEINNRKYITSDFSDLTWKDLNKLPKFAGRSIQILNPETNKIDSLAFLPSIPPQVKGLGRIELDLSGVTPPSKEDENESYIDNPILSYTNKINFSEVIKTAKIYFREDNMPFPPKKEDELEDDVTQTEEEIPEDDTLGEEETTEETTEEIPEEEPEDMGFEEFEEEEEPELAAEEPVDEASLDDIKDVVLEALDEWKEGLLKDMKLMQLEGEKGGGAAPAAVAPTGSMAFSEPVKKHFGAFFGEQASRIKSIERFKRDVNGVETWNESKPVLDKINELQRGVANAINRNDHSGITALFKEMIEVVEKAIGPKTGRPDNISDLDKKLIYKADLSEMPKELATYPKASEFWEQWKSAKPSIALGEHTRAPGLYQEHKGNKSKTAEQQFISYYNRYASQEGLDQIPNSVYKNFAVKKTETKK